jgi:hypothetical protein
LSLNSFADNMKLSGRLKCGRTLGITDRFRAPSFYTECFCRDTVKKWSSSVRPLQQLLKFEYRLILSHIKLYQTLLLWKMEKFSSSDQFLKHSFVF